MKKILITGAEGMLGQDLVPVLEDEGFDVVETDKDSMDVTDLERVKNILDKEDPDIVIHCAAYTNVDKAEEEVELVTKINVIGTENIAKVCSKKNILIVYISTDYVFDGRSERPYESDDETNPLSIYGKTKLAGEDAVKKPCKKYYIVRTSWLYGMYGKNFVETMISLADKGELKVVDDQIGCPTWTVELANGIADLLDEGPEYGTYHICGSGETSWFNFAKEIFKLCGKTVNLLPCKTEDFPRPARRPKYSVMNNNGICRNWKVALKDYINLR